MTILKVIVIVLATIGGIILAGIIVISLLYRLIKSMYSTTGED